MAYVVRQPIRGKVYVYLATSRRVPEKRQSRQRRIYLGTPSEAGDELILGKNSAAPEAAVCRLLEAAGLPWRGVRQQAGAKGRHPAAASLAAGGALGRLAAHRPVESVGEVHVLRGIAEAIGLTETLHATFAAEPAEALLLLAMYQVCEARALYLAEDWLAAVRLDPRVATFDFSSPALSGLLTRLGQDEAVREDFVRRWITRCGKPTAVVHDITSLSTYAADLEGAEFGYNREEKDLPQVNLAVVLDARSGLPLAVRLIQGSVPDVKTLKNTSEHLQAHGLAHVSYSLDRGFYSQANVRDLLQAELGFTLGVPLACRQTRDLITRCRAELQSCARSFRTAGGILRQATAVWQAPLGDGHTRRLVAHLYFDPLRAARQAEQLEQELFDREEKARDEKFADEAEARQWLAENGGRRADCLHTVSDTAGGPRVVRDPVALTTHLGWLGYTVLITDRRDQEGPAVLADYRRRDRAEKLFDILKNEIDQGRFRTGQAPTATGRLFLAFLALILYSGLENAMRDAQLFRSWTIPKALAELRKIRVVSFSTGARYQTEITKRQRTILQALRLPEPACP
jgi:hypothetical protein